MTKATTSSRDVALKNRYRYLKAMILTNVKAAFGIHCFNGLRDNILQYRDVYKKYRNEDFDRAKVLEIGFGQRPTRVFALASMGLDITGVDIEHPTLGFSDFPKVLSRHGVFRMLKAAGRFALFDRKFYSDFSRFLTAEFNYLANFDRSRLVVADSTDPSFWEQNPGPYDFVYSEDVFEHIPFESLPTLIDLMAENMSIGGIALIRPMVFTGICGGHHVDWYTGSFTKLTRRETPPWDHLLENKYQADTFLNQVTRRQYKQLFSTRFDVLEDESELPNLGNEFLTPDLRQELIAYDEYELFSNNVLFILRKRT